MSGKHQQPPSEPKPVPQHLASVEAQGGLFRLRLPGGTPAAAVALRGEIQEFTPQSRKRMLELMARIATDRVGFVCFITLTFPDGDGPLSLDLANRHRTAFLKRLHRAFPQASGIWRREWEERKSGASVGKLYPHYHLLCLRMPFLSHEDLNAMWAGVLGHEGYVRTEIRGLRSWRQALHYVAKYMAKPRVLTPGVGAAEARSKGGAQGASALDRARAARAARNAPRGSLVYVTYLTALKLEQKKTRCSIGRSWGCFNRAHIPFAPCSLSQLPLGAWLRQARLLARQYWQSIDAEELKGFTLFLDNPETFAKQLESLANKEKATKTSAAKGQDGRQ